MIVYMTMVAVRAADSFSWARTKNATADPPKLVGETAELNSQMKISSIDFHQEKSFLVRVLRRYAYERCQMTERTAATPIQTTVWLVH